ncbi:helix-turn-helix transcriptional regulator, partial [bacterium]|nr:helix-turn-helix transcriptional regulator [bacterium]
VLYIYFVEYSNKFSENLARIRREKGISQKDLADRSGISSRMIAHYEKHVSHPALEKIERIAETLNVSIAELLGFTSITKNSEASVSLSNINTRTLKQLKKIIRLNPIDRSTIYKMVDGLLQKEEYKEQKK